jgi:hypothetical protein
MRLKIQGGTVSSGDPSLCLTCRYATIVKGPRLRDEIVNLCGLVAELFRLGVRKRKAHLAILSAIYSAKHKVATK